MIKTGLQAPEHRHEDVQRADAVIGNFLRLKDELVDVREFEVKSVGDYKKSVIAKVYGEYQETLKKSNALDFDDIIVKTVELFKSCPEVLFNYQERSQIYHGG